ncbi:Glyoxylate/hydroxypyruvate reductase B [bioreactor metagenome]|uniref:Glyoxylate/hydroxypyruvate reductase B n=1 Tax=bioreactor metagenome TaxID=1076179 RepID=A0A645IE39_9ZZZZ
MSQEKIQSLGARKVELDELLKTSDIVSIHAPSIKETYKMINEHTLSLMKKDAVLINTARGSLIDENALYNHMKAGNLKYACLDVTDPEPPAVNNPLRSLPNVILTPHLAGLVNYGKRKIGIHVCEEIKKYLEDRPMDCEVTEKMLATMA